MASDISSEAVNRARRAVYPASALTNYPELLDRYFRSHGRNSIEAVESLKQHVTFYTQNLLDRESRYHGQMDFIYCQNVLIYFKTWRRRELINYFSDCLKPGGCLVIGPGEITDWRPQNLVRLNVPDVQVYEKRHNCE